jgi:ubiquinone/menaquinone biosynthesis C-methylase UbiE
MQDAYSQAHNEIVIALREGGACLDCGAHLGQKYEFLHARIGMHKSRYNGIEWNADLVRVARGKGLNVLRGDLNKEMPFEDQAYRCIFGLSVLEHLLNPCKYLRECYRCLEKKWSVGYFDAKYQHIFYSCLNFSWKNAIKWTVSRFKCVVTARAAI